MTTTREIRLDFLDVKTDERRPLNGDITKQVNPVSKNPKSQLYAQRNILAIASRLLYTTNQSRSQDQELLQGG